MTIRAEGKPGATHSNKIQGDSTRMGRIYWTQDQIDYIIKRYTIDKVDCPTIAKEMNCSRSAINNVLRRNNVNTEVPEDIANKIVDNYILKRMGASSAGKEWGLSAEKTKKILKQKGIKLRTYIESKPTLRKYHVDENFFKKQNHDMAYILGFIAATGNISKSENCISIEVHQKDRLLLEKIQKIIQNDRPLKEYIHNGEPVVVMRAWSHEWKQDLGVYNIFPDKLALKPPYFLNKEYYISYIKGYFDGNPENNDIKFSGINQDIILWIRYTLAYQCGIVGGYNISLNLENNEIYTINYSTLREIQFLYKSWYIDNKSDLFLERKKQLFESVAKRL